MNLRRVFTIAFQLSSVGRFSRDHMLKSENVLEHIGFCSFYSLLLAKKLIQEGVPVDLGVLFSKVSVHDIDEALLGDVPRTTKYFSENIRSEFSAAETSIVSKIENWLDSSLVADWKTAKEGLEGEILKVADLAAVVYKNWVEIELLGNRSFMRVARETNEFLNEFDFRSLSVVQLQQELEKLFLLNSALLRDEKVSEIDEIFLNMKGK